MTEYAPCPTCGQYSHSIPEDRVAAAFNHFHMMYDPRGDEIPTQHWFDDHTRDHAQVLVAEIERLRGEVLSLTTAMHDARGLCQQALIRSISRTWRTRPRRGG